jgi:tetratricopeptide (TPR) repeat protein
MPGFIGGSGAELTALMAQLKTLQRIEIVQALAQSDLETAIHANVDAPDGSKQWQSERSFTGMIRHLAQLLSIPLTLVLSLSAQSDVHQQLQAAAELCSQGHFEQAIALARPALDSTQLTQAERGKGWTLLGFAFQYQGEYQEAMSDYENALRSLEERGENAADYASALSAFGTLFRDMHQFDAAAQMQMQALRVSRRINDHREIAVVCANLADLELGLKHTKKAQAWLNESAQESRLASDLDESFYAFVASSEAWLAELKGNTGAATVGYQKEIDYLTHSPGEQSPSLGWAYMLLGKANLNSGDIRGALSNMSKGRSMLMQTVGAGNPRYLLAQVAYAQALDSAGMHTQAIQTRSDAEQKLKVIYKKQCTQCRVTALALH